MPLPDYNPRRVAFQFNQETFVGTSLFPDSFHFRPNHARIQNVIVTERHHPQNIGAGQAFLFFIPSTWNSNLKTLAHHRPCQKRSVNTTWMNLCPHLASAHDSLKNRTPPQIFPIPRKHNILKKFRINIILNLPKPSIKSSVNGFRQIS